MKKHIVAVKGQIVPEKMLKKLKKKTGKKVEIVIPKDGTKVAIMKLKFLLKKIENLNVHTKKHEYYMRKISNGYIVKFVPLKSDKASRL
ncbi:hypothetical protein Syun_014034 [Stephania yunnanensis]|uniref:Uncharacterized protein n=1 Tax=Stephania yunnanensis TaxID=152371 RepID=A0AAP0JIZ6_9MAGN